MPDSDPPYKSLRELLAREWSRRSAIVSLVEPLGVHGSELLDSGSTPLEIWHHLLSGRRDKISTITAAFTALHPDQAKLIERLREDWMRVPPPPPHPSHRLSRRLFNLPASIGSLFKGREAFLERLHQSLRAGTGGEAAAITAPQAVHGLGGIGKTRTAIEYARRHQEDYSVLIMVGADSKPTLRTNLANLALSDALGLPEQSVPEEDVRFEAVLRWLEANPGWLLILDNVDTEEAATAVEGLLGRLSAGYVLITSRLNAWSGQVRGSDLQTLKEEDAISFLMERTGGRRQAKVSDGEDVAALATRLDGLALALEQAGAYLGTHRISFRRYMEIFDTRLLEVLKWCDPRLMVYPVSVAVTWQTSFERLSSPARSLLDILAFLSPDPIPRSMIENNGGGPALEEALVELSRYSLVRFLDEPPETFSVHRLVQEIVRSRFHGTAQAALKKTVDLLLREVPKDSEDPSTWNDWRRLAPHCKAVLAVTEPQEECPSIIQLMSGYADFLNYGEAQYATAEPLYRQALEVRKRTPGPEHPDTLDSLNNLARLLKSKGDHVAAEPLYRQALEVRRRTLGPEHPGTLTSRNNLALLLHSKGDYVAAEPLYREVLEARERVLGPEHPDTLASLNDLAALLQAKGDLEEAEPLLRHALEVMNRVLGPEHPSTLTCVNNLGGLLHAKAKYTAAEPLLRRALEARNRVLGPNHPHTLNTLNNLAVLLQDKGDLAAAEPLFRQALEGRKCVLGQNHPHTVDSLNNLAWLLNAKGNYAEAKLLFHQSQECMPGS